jgi:hypothetical protein
MMMMMMMMMMKGMYDPERSWWLGTEDKTPKKGHIWKYSPYYIYHVFGPQAPVDLTGEQGRDFGLWRQG